MNFKINQLTVTFHGREIVTDATLEINQGHRYGLIGLNGSGWLILQEYLEQSLLCL